MAKKKKWRSLSFTCSTGKTFFFIKVEGKQLRLNSLASFTNIGPYTVEIDAGTCGNVAIPL